MYKYFFSQATSILFIPEEGMCEEQLSNCHVYTYCNVVTNPPHHCNVCSDAPVCSSDTDTTQVLASGIGQTLNVSCSVIASPSDVRFSWVFNNSVTSERVPVERVLNSQGKRLFYVLHCQLGKFAQY